MSASTSQSTLFVYQVRGIEHVRLWNLTDEPPAWEPSGQMELVHTTPALGTYVCCSRWTLPPPY